MAWVRFPDGSRRRVERVTKTDAQHDLEELLALRAQGLDPGPRHTRQVSFNEVLDAWFAEGCPNVAPSAKSRHATVKSPNTISNARYLLDGNVRPEIGKLWVDRTTTQRLEALFSGMADAGYATSTIDRTWNYLNQACQYGVRRGQIKTNPATAVLLPAARPAKARRSFTLEQAERLLLHAIPSDTRPAMWLTGLMCGLRPGELVGLRWCYVDVDSQDSSIDVTERALAVNHRYAGQAVPKTPRSRRRIGLHPLLVAALRRHRDEMSLLGLYDPEGFVFCTSKGTPMSLANLRRAFRDLCLRDPVDGDRVPGGHGQHLQQCSALPAPKVAKRHALHLERPKGPNAHAPSSPMLRQACGVRRGCIRGGWRSARPHRVVPARRVAGTPAHAGEGATPLTAGDTGRSF